MFRKRLKNEKGQAMVEMALVLPLFLGLVLSIIEFGWIFHNKLAVVNSTRDVARVISIDNKFPKTLTYTKADGVTETTTFNETEISDYAEALMSYRTGFSYADDLLPAKISATPRTSFRVEAELRRVENRVEIKTIYYLKNITPMSTIAGLISRDAVGSSSGYTRLEYEYHMQLEEF